MSDCALKTPLFDWHATHSARMVDFAGWSMPVQYGSIVEEHLATRQAVGLFDISHMGRFYLSGPGAGQLLEGLFSRGVLGMRPGRIRYGLMTNAQGGILDDVLVYRLPEGDQIQPHLLVVNASNRQKILDWILEHRSESDEVIIQDRTLETAMLAVQGPGARDLVAEAVDVNLASLKYYTGTTASVLGQQAYVSRTGYTGEDGCEFIVSRTLAASLWQQLLQVGVPHGARPAGLGARDTLRLEAAMPLYGHELDEQISPYQAGLAFAVQLQDRQFVGREVLMELSRSEDLPRRVGLQFAGRRVPRETCPLLIDGQAVGRVTSGTFSPTLQCPIAMAYMPPNRSEIGTPVVAQLRGRPVEGQIVELPFYTRSS